MDSRRQRQSNLIQWPVLFALVTLGFVGCDVTRSFYSNDPVSRDVQHRMGHSLAPTEQLHHEALPPGISIEDGLTEEETIAIALWRNTAYRALLAELGISHARLFDAGLYVDPQFIAFFPLGPKQLEFAFFFSVDALWLRPIRERVAKLDLARVTDQMVQNGLNVIRDARLAHANLLFAQERAQLAKEAQQLRKEISDLATKRLVAGDSSRLEAMAVQVDAVTAEADAKRLAQDVILAQNNLRAVLGLSFGHPSLVATSSRLPEVLQDEKAIVREALAIRPDLRAAEVAVELALERTNVERNRFMTLEAVLDANSRGTKGFEAGPGVRMTIPLFNRNRGNVAIADAQWEQAKRQSFALRDQIVLEVRTAHVQAKQAAENLETLQKEVLPTLQSSIELARRNFQRGGSAYLLVLQTTAQYLNTKAQELDLSAALRRAHAELERSVGHRLIPAEGMEPSVVLSEIDPSQESSSHARIRIPLHNTVRSAPDRLR